MTAYETLPGRSKENARAALDKAVENGFAEEDVLTVRDGYLIPTNAEPDEADSQGSEKSEESAEDEPKPARRSRAKTKEE